MINRLAKVLADRQLAFAPQRDMPDWQFFVDGARDVIEAMREPTEAMIVQGADGGEGAHIVSWHIMIDEALK